MNDIEVFVDELKRKAKMPATHFHNYYEFYYLIKGKISYFVDNSVYVLNAGDIIFIPVGAIHKTATISENGYKRVLINVKKEVVDSLANLDGRVNDIISKKLFNLTGHTKSAVEGIIKRIVTNKTDKLLSVCLIGELFSALNFTNENAYVISNPLVSSVTEYINREFANDITLDELSKIFYINPSQLSREFKKATGFCYSDYLVKIRISNACKLLKNTHLNLTEIAERVGYNSSNHFCKSFKGQMGISPLNYRKYTI